MTAYKVVVVGEFPRSASSIQGGIQASTFGLAVSLQKCPQVNGVKVFALPFNQQSKSGTDVVEGIDVVFLDTPYNFMMSSIVYLKQVWREIVSCGPQVVHVHGTGLFQALLCLFARINKVPFVWTMHGITAKETLKRFKERKSPANFLRYIIYSVLERLQVLIAPEIIVDTMYVREVMPPTKNHISVIPQGIFSQEFSLMDTQKRQSPVILSLGVMDPRKGHHLTLEAFAKIKQAIPDAELIIAGAETLPSYSEQIRLRVHELGLSDSVTVLVNLKRHEIIELLGKARVFGLHSQEESQGIALCEALASGLPIVATRVGGIPFVVTDGLDGILIDYADVDAFAQALTALLSDAEKYAQMATAAKNSGRRFDWHNIALEICAIYQNAIRFSARA